MRGLLTVLSVAVVSSPEEGPLLHTQDVRLALWTTRSMAAIPEEKTEAPPLGKEVLTELMERFHGKVAAAARHAGVTRPKLYRLLWANEIESTRFRTV